MDMKLELDLLRELLLYVEEKADRPVSALEDITIEGWTREQIAYHVIIAAEDGLIKAIIDDVPDTEDPDIVNVAYIVNRLTGRGHEMLGVIRAPKHWRWIKAQSSKVGVATVGALFKLGQDYVKMELGLG
ncbi:hypothetical protein GGR03_001723 [Aurantimonas endophytica]|uniref:DUF2513 domain-containing protein n=2 Tax=Aurantimonas endophytica TaxID=1522175 RepID=A0A7W6HCI5_9HYPH|nr:hypothetical protein [Aurantimonas endophytica]